MGDPWLLSYANVHPDVLRFLVYPLAIPPLHNLADQLGDEDPLAALFFVPPGKNAAMLIGSPVRTMVGNKAEHGYY
jgi:hypothetical protein